MSPTSVSWRRFKDHSVITGMDNAPMQNVDGEDLRMVCLVLDQLDRLMLDEYLDKYNGKISWKHKVVGVGQDEKQAWVDVETPEGNKKVYGDYIVGCDGANSAVRKSLFGDEFPGFTWDQQIVASNVSRRRRSDSNVFLGRLTHTQVYYDFTKFGFKDSSFILHPEHFFVSSLRADPLPPSHYQTPYPKADAMLTKPFFPSC